jgi:hypothetical protein
MQFIGLLLLLIGAGMFVLLYGMRLKAARTDKLMRLYEQALERGMDPRAIKFELDEAEVGDPAGNLKAGIILLAVALAMLGGLWAAQQLQGPWRALGFAFVPAAVGLAALFIHFSLTGRGSRPTP